MRRDMDLVRVILLKIEEEHAGVGLANLEVEGYDCAIIAYHCQLLEEAGLVSSCIVRYADDSVVFFSVGGLTWEGADYLDKVRDDSVWAKTKNLAAEKGVPLVVETVKTISSAVVSSLAEGVASALLKG